MPSELVRPIGYEAATGRVGGTQVIHKFGQNDSVGTTFVPVARGGDYQTPQVSGATTLRIAAGNAADVDTTGAGARKVTLQGLDASGNLVSEEISTNGTSAGTASSTSFLRLFRAFVSESGTYATSTAGSHQADIVIENGAGGTTWATIGSTGFPRGQTEIAVYSVPTGKCGYIKSFFASTDSAKTTELLLFRRENILETAAPYSAMRALFECVLEGGTANVTTDSPIRVDGPADVGFMAKVDSTTAAVSIDFELIIEDV